VEEGLRDAGFSDIARVAPESAFVAEVERLAPDVVIFGLGSPDTDTFREMLSVSRSLARPVAMFIDRSDDAMIGAAIEAGVSAYVVDGLRKDRVKPVLDLAIRRFRALSQLEKELSEAKTALAERKSIDAAKRFLMNDRGLSEANAYAMLRSVAMRQSKRIAEVAEALLTASDLLNGKNR